MRRDGGTLGATGRGTDERCGSFGRVGISTGTLGKALGTASGGFISERREVIALLRQQPCPYLFSNSVAPSIVGPRIAVADLLESSTTLRDQLESNTRYSRGAIAEADVAMKPAQHPVVPIMIHDAVKAEPLAKRLLELGLYVIAFSHPEVGVSGRGARGLVDGDE